MEMEAPSHARLWAQQDSSCHDPKALGTNHVTCPKVNPCWLPVREVSPLRLTLSEFWGGGRSQLDAIPSAAQPNLRQRSRSPFCCSQQQSNYTWKFCCRNMSWEKPRVSWLGWKSSPNIITSN